MLARLAGANVKEKAGSGPSRPLSVKKVTNYARTRSSIERFRPRFDSIFSFFCGGAAATQLTIMPLCSSGQFGACAPIRTLPLSAIALGVAVRTTIPFSRTGQFGA